MNARKARMIRFNSRAGYDMNTPGSFRSYYRKEKRAYSAMDRHTKRRFTIMALKPASFRVD